MFIIYRELVFGHVSYSGTHRERYILLATLRFARLGRCYCSYSILIKCKIKDCSCIKESLGGGILPVSWYTGMCHGFWVPFQQFWYRDGVSFKKVFTKKHQQMYKLGSFCDEIGCFLRQIGISMGRNFLRKKV